MDKVHLQAFLAGLALGMVLIAYVAWGGEVIAGDYPTIDAMSLIGDLAECENTIGHLLAAIEAVRDAMLSDGYSEHNQWVEMLSEELDRHSGD